MPWWIAWKANQLYFRLSGDIAWNFIHKIEPSWMLDVKLLLTMHLFLKWWVCSKIKQYLYHNNWLNRMNKIETLSLNKTNWRLNRLTGRGWIKILFFGGLTCCLYGRSFYNLKNVFKLEILNFETLKLSANWELLP